MRKIKRIYFYKYYTKIFNYKAKLYCRRSHSKGDIYNKLFNDSKRRQIIIKELEKKLYQNEEKICTFSPKINLYKDFELKKQNFDTPPYINENFQNNNNYNTIDCMSQRKYILKSNEKNNFNSLKNISRNYNDSNMCYIMDDYYSNNMSNIPVNYNVCNLNKNNSNYKDGYKSQYNNIFKTPNNKFQLYDKPFYTTQRKINYSTNLNKNIENFHDMNNPSYCTDIHKGNKLFKKRIKGTKDSNLMKVLSNSKTNKTHFNKNMNEDSKNNNFENDYDSMKSSNKMIQTLNNYTISEQTIPVNYDKKKVKNILKNYKNKLIYRRNNKSLTNKNSSSSFANYSNNSKNYFKSGGQTLSINKEEAKSNLVYNIPHKIKKFNEKSKKDKLMNIYEDDYDKKNGFIMKINNSYGENNMIYNSGSSLKPSYYTNYTNNETKGWSASTLSLKDGQINKNNSYRDKKYARKLNNSKNKNNRNIVDKINKLNYYNAINSKLEDDCKHERVTTLQSISDSKIFDLADYYINSTYNCGNDIELKKFNFKIN